MIFVFRFMTLPIPARRRHGALRGSLATRIPPNETRASPPNGEARPGSTRASDQKSVSAEIAGQAGRRRLPAFVERSNARHDARRRRRQGLRRRRELFQDGLVRRRGDRHSSERRAARNAGHTRMRRRSICRMTIFRAFRRRGSALDRAKADSTEHGEHDGDHQASEGPLTEHRSSLLTRAPKGDNLVAENQSSTAEVRPQPRVPSRSEKAAPARPDSESRERARGTPSHIRETGSP